MSTTRDSIQPNRNAPMLQRDFGQFNAIRIRDLPKMAGGPVTYNSRDYYKISLYQGNSIYHYADKSLEISGTNLLFFSPKVPYTLEKVSGENNGCFCIFTEAFFRDQPLANLGELPMFKPGGKSFYTLDVEQEAHLELIFEKILTEAGSDYLYKYDLIRALVSELIHFALKLQPSENVYKHPDSNSRLTSVFTELLERQFPIESTQQRLEMRSASDYAGQLSVHVNHLNRAIRETTGKTTTYRISERMIKEAKALLKHTGWNVAEIAYCLGFEEPAHFHHFFKKQTGITPSAFRAS